jgi:N-methylhydantoinase A/oxoprolinase/acetone carboxylase beta subunit
LLLLGFDTGGTYTDAVLFDPERGTVVASAKALTTKHDLIVGLRGAMEAVLPSAAPDIGMVSLSTTLATNAIVEGQGSPICLLLLGYDAGALDRADLRRALGSDPVEFIAGGHDAVGDAQAPLDMAALEAAVRRHADSVAAFAVSGFFSVRNPAHEIAAHDFIRQSTGLPVSCGHELTSKLDAPRRALTTALNARLVPQLQQLIEAVKALLRERDIAAPLMVVKGDGSLVAAEVALDRPVETVLSGPAASVVGARHLSGEGDVLVVDMGGTTTDIALLQNGRPVLDRDGATVAGWKTMVEAVAVHTYGLGGDSEVRRTDGGLAIGPHRLVPLSLLAHQHPRTLDILRGQRAADRLEPGASRFALRNRILDTHAASLTAAQSTLWQALADGPLPTSQIATGYVATKALERLVHRGLVVLSGFTPSDAAHVLALQDGWSAEAARLGAELWIREDAAAVRPADASADVFARRVLESVTRESGRAIIAAALATEGEGELEAGGPLGHRLIERALSPERDSSNLLRTSLTIQRSLVAIGAPAATYYPEVARRVGARLVVPQYAGVCNAIGAVAGGILQSVTALITAPNEGRFRIHLPSGTRDFGTLETAAAEALKEATSLATEQARRAGADAIEVTHRRLDKVHRDGMGAAIFLESRIEVTAFGRPRVAGG